MSRIPTLSRRIFVCSCLLVTALASPIAGGQARSSDLRTVSIGELKEAYLACERATGSRALAGSEAMQCSVVYEELKRRAFAGDFNMLLAWWRDQQPSRVSGR
jgi:hypothetical protein